jgi:hypothetical protein
MNEVWFLKNDTTHIKLLGNWFLVDCDYAGLITGGNTFNLGDPASLSQFTTTWS